MANIYWRKRTQANIEAIDMAEKLGIPLEKYREIEMGERDMPKRLMDLFHKTVNEAKEQPNIVKLENAQNEKEYDEWIEDILKDDRIGLKNLMSKFNIDNYQELGNLLGGYSKNTLTMYFTYPNKMNYSFKKKFYDFFHNEINIQLPSIKEFKPRKKKIRENLVMMSDEDKTLITQYLEKEHMSRMKFCEVLGINNNTFTGYWRKERAMPKELLERIKNIIESDSPVIEKSYVSNVEPKEVIVMEEKNIDERISDVEEQLKKLIKEKKKTAELEKFKDEVDESTSKMALFRQSLIDNGIPESLADQIVLQSIATVQAL